MLKKKQILGAKIQKMSVTTKSEAAVSQISKSEETSAPIRKTQVTPLNEPDIDEQIKLVLVTGANGFIGSALCPILVEAGFEVRRAVRTEKLAIDGEIVAVGNINANTDWSNALQDVDVVIHLASRVHMLNDTSPDPLSEFRKVNLEGTRKLAQAAVAQGIKRFIFVSSVKVCGEENTPRRPYTESMKPQPRDPYGISKWEAEQVVLEIGASSGMEVVCVRPPIVYGVGVGANFLRLIKLIERGIPLPLGNTGNQRSMVYVKNLCDFLKTCLWHPDAVGEIFLVSDNHDLSTTELIRRIALHLDKSPLLLPVPGWLVSIPASLIGKQNIVMRLWGSLVIDIRKAGETLNWTPPFSVDEGIAETVKWHQSQSWRQE